MTPSVSIFEVGLGELPSGCGAPMPPSMNAPQRGEVAIPIGADSVALAFSPAFSSAPFPPTCTVLKPTAASDDISVETVADLTTAGCTVFLSAAVAVAGYILAFDVEPQSSTIGA